MGDEGALRSQLQDLLRGGHAHMNLGAAVEAFPMEFINAFPPEVPYTPWHLLEHIRISQWDILEFITDPQHVSPEWPEGYWPPKNQMADPAMWEATLTRYHGDQRELEDMVEDPATDLTKELPHAPGHSLLREILVVSDHHAYHIGEFAILRQIMQTWPSDRA